MLERVPFSILPNEFCLIQKLSKNHVGKNPELQVYQDILDEKILEFSNDGMECVGNWILFIQYVLLYTNPLDLDRSELFQYYLLCEYFNVFQYPIDKLDKIYAEATNDKQNSAKVSGNN